MNAIRQPDPRREPGARTFPRFLPLGATALAMAMAACSTATPAAPDRPAVAGPTPTADPNSLVWLLGRGPTSLDPSRLAMDEETASLDPNGQLVAAQVYDRLVQLRPGTAQLAPGLAESWQENVIENTVTFTLREGLTFHDGTPLGAREVAWNFERWMNLEHPQHQDDFQVWEGFFGFVGQKDSAGRDAFIVEAVEAIGPRQVRFKLTASFSPFISHLALVSFGIASPKAVQDQGAAYGTDGAHLPVGSGPYRVIAWDSGGSQAVTLAPFPGHLPVAPANSGLRFLVEPDAGKRVESVASGQAIGTEIQPLTPLTGTLTSSAVVVAPRPSRSTAWLMLDDSRPPLNDPNVRKAISLAIDRSALVRDTFGARSIPASQPLPPGFFGHNDAVLVTGQDLERGKALLAEAEVESFRLNIWAPEVARPFLPDPVRTAEKLAEDLKALGIEAEARSAPLRQFLRDREAGRYIAWLIGWEAQSADPDSFWYWHFGIPDRIVAEGHYDNKALAQALAKAQRVDTDTRRQIYQDAATTVDEDTARVFLAHPQALVVLSPRLRGFEPGPLSIDSFDRATLGDASAPVTPATPGADATAEGTAGPASGEAPVQLSPLPPETMTPEAPSP